MGLFGTSPSDIQKWQQKGKTEKIINALTHKNYQVRKAAVKAIGDMKLLSSFQLVVKALNDTTSDVTKEAITSLGKLGTREAFEVLAEFYDKNPLWSYYINNAVLQIDILESRLFLFNCIAHKGITNKKNINDAQILFEIKDTSYVSQLESILEGLPSWDALEFAVDILREINDKRANISLKPFLLHQNDELRKKVALTMSYLGEKKWKTIVTGDRDKDIARIIEDGDQSLINKMMFHIRTSRSNLWWLYISAIIKSGDKALCNQASKIIFEKDKTYVLTYIELFAIGENREVIDFLKENLFTTTPENRKKISETLAKFGDTQLKGVVNGDNDDFANLLMINYPGVKEFMFNQMATESKYTNRLFVESFIKVASRDISRIKDWQEVHRAINAPHNDVSTSDHEDIGPSNSDCHSDFHNSHHTDIGVSKDFTPEQEIILSRMQIAELLTNSTNPDDVVIACIKNNDEAYLTDHLKKNKVQSFKVLEELSNFCLKSRDSHLRKEIEKHLFVADEQHNKLLNGLVPKCIKDNNIGFIIKYLKWFDVTPMEVLEEIAPMYFTSTSDEIKSLVANQLFQPDEHHLNLLNRLIPVAIKNKDEDFIIRYLNQYNAPSIEPLEEIAEFYSLSANLELKQRVEKLIFQSDKPHLELLSRLLNEIPNWEIDPKILLGLGDCISDYVISVVPKNPNEKLCTVIMNVLSELNTEKSLNALRFFMFHQSANIKRQIHFILKDKGEDYSVKASEKNKLLIEERNPRLIYAFKRAFNYVLPQYKHLILETYYDFADEEILDIAMNYFEDADVNEKLIILKIAGKVKTDRSKVFLEEQIFSETDEIRKAAADGLLEHGFRYWEGKIKGDSSDYLTFAREQSDEILNRLVNCNSYIISDVIRALGKSENPKAYDALLKISERDDDTYIIEDLCNAYAALNDKRAIPTIKAELLTSNPSLRKSAGLALAKLEADYWQHIFRGDDDDFSRLSDYPNNDTISILKQLFESPILERRRAAAKGIVAIAQKDFNLVSSFWKEYYPKLSQNHEDSRNHNDHDAGTRSGDCHTDESKHTDSGIGIEIPASLKL